jgi:uncharacterized membrane protein YgaE (UPF0421/DUF939 family)
MIKKLSFFKLTREAVLLDSGFYILKALIAVIAAYIISQNNPILKLDIISVLFGLMLTLEPVNLTGIRNGANQLYSTCLGAAATAVIIYLFGINVITVALSIAFTLYVCLKIDWRAVSPVAIFTSIYMTQYIQRTAEGDPSIILTFRLRIFALLSGIVIAIIFNYIFSRFYYKSMINKRISFLLSGIIESLKLTAEAIKKGEVEYFYKSQKVLPNNFNNIDWVFSLFNDIKKEYKLKSKIIRLPIEDIEKLINIILFIRSISHLNYDINYVYIEEEPNLIGYKAINNRFLKNITFIIEELEKIYEAYENKKVLYENYSNSDNGSGIYQMDSNNENCVRIDQDINNIKNIIYKMYRETSHLNNIF